MIENKPKKILRNTLESITLAGIIFSSSCFSGCRTIPLGSYPEEAWIKDEYNLTNNKETNFFRSRVNSYNFKLSEKDKISVLKRYTRINKSSLIKEEIEYFNDFNKYLKENNGLSKKEMKWIHKNYSFISQDSDPKKWPVNDKIFIMQEIYRVKYGKKIKEESALSYKDSFTP
ncbi:MAG TPA: hypothetical protein P5277_00805 [Candidatus Paceibacterota bacterium]|nr:hypothetical protein [Candidatus Paceibacterota bacterium]